MNRTHCSRSLKRSAFWIIAGYSLLLNICVTLITTTPTSRHPQASDNTAKAVLAKAVPAKAVPAKAAPAARPATPTINIIEDLEAAPPLIDYAYKAAADPKNFFGDGAELTMEQLSQAVEYEVACLEKKYKR